MPATWQLDGEPVRAREVAAIIRFADELAEGPQRTSSYMRGRAGYAPDSAPHHDYSAATDIAIDKGNNRIAVTYQFNVVTEKGIEEELSKLKESLEFAYRRLGKMNLERKYARFHCSRPLDSFQNITVCLEVQIDGEYVDPPLRTVISDEVSPDDEPVSLPGRDSRWDPDTIADQIRKEASRRAGREGRNGF